MVSNEKYLVDIKKIAHENEPNEHLLYLLAIILPVYDMDAPQKIAKKVQTMPTTQLVIGMLSKNVDIHHICAVSQRRKG